jgi:hypothetical protein
VNTGLLVAAVLLLLVAIAHSVLGERYILIRLFRRSDLPRLFGGDAFTRSVLRFAWHLTSIAWLGFAAILAILAGGTAASAPVLRVVAATFAVHAVVVAAASRGRHLAWPVFAAVALLAWLAG